MEDKKLEIEYINRIPIDGLVQVINTVMLMKIKVETDPNLDSQSPQVK
jgi:hypothetical protein